MKAFIVSIPDGDDKLVNYFQTINGWDIFELPRPKNHLKASSYEWGNKRTNIASLLKMGKDNRYIDGWNDCLRAIFNNLRK